MNKAINNKRNYCVYVHINKYNQKKYVGITCKKPEDRWENGNGYKTQAFYKAIEKYGWKNFEHIVLDKNLTLDEACEKEKYYINLYDSYNNGYNSSLGGECLTQGVYNNPVKKIICINSQKIYNSTKELSEMLNISQENIYAHIHRHKPILIEKKYFMFDYYEKDKEYILIDYYKVNHNSVICIDTLEIFWNFVEAANYANVTPCSLRKVCKHEMNHVHGLHFLYLKEYLECGTQSVDYSLRRRKVLCLSTNEVFNSIVEGANQYNLTARNVFNCCAGKSKHAGKYNNVPLVWQYYDEYFIKPKEYNDIIENSLIHCITLNLYFESIREASRYTKIGRKKIKSSCEGIQKRDNASNNYEWEYYTPSIKEKIEVIKCPIIKNPK